MKTTELGIIEYVTDSPGIGGKIKSIAEDFIVEEKSYNYNCSVRKSIKNLFFDSLFFLRPKKKYVHATLVKKDYTTLKALRTLEKVFSCEIGYAGLKDKRAITAQRISIPSNHFKKVKLKDICLKDFSYSSQKIGIGELWGNKFTVTIRENNLEPFEFMGELQAKDWMLPNYFGEQRFGANNTHLVGKYLLKGDFESAAKELLTGGNSRAESWRKARLELLKAWPDIKSVELAKGMWIEKDFIKYVNGSFREAFFKMKRNILTLYVHAFQSYIFNMVLSRKLEKGHRPVEIEVPGYKSSFSDEDLNQVLNSSGVSAGDFRKLSKYINSAGEMRNAFMNIKGFKILGKKPLKVSFSLRKGSYATILLNELIKS